MDGKVEKLFWNNHDWFLRTSFCFKIHFFKEFFSSIVHQRNKLTIFWLSSNGTVRSFVEFSSECFHVCGSVYVSDILCVK